MFKTSSIIKKFLIYCGRANLIETKKLGDIFILCKISVSVCRPNRNYGRGCIALI